MAKIGDHENQLRALREAKLKSSRGSRESRPASKVVEEMECTQPPHTDERHGLRISVQAETCSAPVRSSDRVEKRFKSLPTTPQSTQGMAELTTKAGVASGPREVKRKTGRPLAKDADKTLKKLRPWVALGMSERTWYRRQAEQRAKEKQ